MSHALCRRTVLAAAPIPAAPPSAGPRPAAPRPALPHSLPSLGAQGIRRIPGRGRKSRSASLSWEPLVPVTESSTSLSHLTGWSAQDQSPRASSQPAHQEWFQTPVPLNPCFKVTPGNVTPCDSKPSARPLRGHRPPWPDALPMPGTRQVLSRTNWHNPKLLHQSRVLRLRCFSRWPRTVAE